MHSIMSVGDTIISKYIQNIPVCDMQVHAQPEYERTLQKQRFANVQHFYTCYLLVAVCLHL